MSVAPVTIVIVSYRSRETLPEAMTAVIEAHERGLAECVVVDNHGKDGVRELLSAEFPWVRVLHPEENIGFARGCNLGIEHATSPYILLLNPDAVFPADALDLLKRFLDAHPRAALIAPAIREPDDCLQHVGGLPTPMSLIRDVLGSRSSGRCFLKPGTAPFRTDWLCGAVLLLRREAILSIGGFDPRFFLYFEETDLCCRAIEAGWELWSVGEAVAYHRNAASCESEALMYHGCVAEHYFRSRFYYLAKHHGWLAAAAAEIGELILLGARSTVRVAFGQPDDGGVQIRMRSPILQSPSLPPGIGVS